MEERKKYLDNIRWMTVILVMVYHVVYIFCMSGEGPLWFARELFLASLVLVLIRNIDKKGKLEALCNQMKWWGFILLFVSFWGSSFLLNTPLIEVYRNGIYINCFLMGYYIFSNEKHLEVLEKAKRFLVAAAVLCTLGYYIYIRLVIEPQATDNILTTVAYTSKSVLQHPFTNIFAWITILAVFSVARGSLNFCNGFSTYMTKANFGYYALHYVCLTVVAFWVLEKTGGGYFFLCQPRTAGTTAKRRQNGVV